jgi:hypothetical protein
MAKRFPSNPFMKIYRGGHKGKFHRPEGAGNFDNMDDVNIVQSLTAKNGTIQHTPSNDKDIVNKEYADDTFQTSLSVTSPIQLIADTLSFSFSTANTWTGTNIFQDEVEGTKHSTVFSQNDEIQIGFIADKFIELGGVELSTAKGMTTLRAGSLVGVTVNYDCTSVAKVSSLQIQVMKNGTRVWNNNLVTTTGTNKRFEFTQARDVDAFVAGDFLGISFAASGVAGTIDLEKIIVELIYYYDD